MHKSEVQRLSDDWRANVNFVATVATAATAARRYGLLTTNGDVTTSFFVAYVRKGAREREAH